MPIFDSDFLIAFLRNDDKAVRLLKNLEETHQILGTTVINVFEVMLGTLLHSNPEQKKAQAEALMQALTIFPMSLSASNLAASLTAKLIKSGNRIDFPDVAIAAITIENNDILYTRNAKHFSRIEGLSFREW